jgi:HK97 family phage major capsid protein
MTEQQTTSTDVEILAELRGKDVANLTGDTPDELRGKTPDELQAFLEVLDAHLRSLHQTDEGELRDKTPDEAKAFAYGLALRDKLVSRLEEHRAIAEVFRRRPQQVQQAYTNIRHGLDDPAGDLRRVPNAEVRQRALRLLDGDRTATAHLGADQKAQVERHIRRDPDMARRLLVTENDAYREAFMKMVTHPQGQLLLTDDERQAIRQFEEYRAMSENTTTAGGFGIPVLIDPSIILTAQGSGNPFLTLARSVEVNTNIWKGVSSAGVSWSFDTEAAAVSDDSPTLAQPTVTVHMARGFIPFSIEVGQDYPGFAEEMSALLAEGYDELLVDKFSRGSGTGEPQGLITGLDADTNVEVTPTTDGAFGQEDVYKVRKALPQRFRRNASWMMSVDVNNRIRQFGSANVFHAFTENLPAEWADTLFGKTVYESPYFPDFTGTTGAANLLVVGDFRNYLIARRGGMSVELVPHLFDTTASNRPTGQRGWFAYARIGGGVVNTLGFRLLQNQ